MSESLSLLLMDIYVLTLGRSRKVIPPPWYKGEESFWYAAAFRKDYTFSEEPFIFPKDEVYFIGSGAAKTCGVTKHGRHLGHHLRFYR